jgi:hypothetical protein
MFGIDHADICKVAAKPNDRCGGQQTIGNISKGNDYEKRLPSAVGEPETDRRKQKQNTRQTREQIKNAIRHAENRFESRKN